MGLFQLYLVGGCGQKRGSIYKVKKGGVENYDESGNIFIVTGAVGGF
jgi:hypothetical protein